MCVAFRAQDRDALGSSGMICVLKGTGDSFTEISAQAEVFSYFLTEKVSLFLHWTSVKMMSVNRA